MTAPQREIDIICDKLILATGLTSVPKLPSIDSIQCSEESSPRVIHAKEIGTWTREYLGYQPIPNSTLKIQSIGKAEPTGRNIGSVVIYGGAKSSFDLVHFFATLHRTGSSLHLNFTPEDPVQVHWVIRGKGTGPSWMVPPTSSLPNGDTVTSDKAASTRLLHYLAPCSNEIPKRISFAAWGTCTGGSWLARLLHGNALGRWWVRRFWNSVELSLEEFAQYEAKSKMRKLRPNQW